MTEQIGDATVTRSSIIMPGGLPWTAQLGDIVARGSTREAAIDALIQALERQIAMLPIRGSVNPRLGLGT